jgi:hypothetical protein
MKSAIALEEIDLLVGNRLGTLDLPCPLCGPRKRAVRNQQRKTLRVWRIEPGFAGFFCARCGEKGAALDRNGSRPDPGVLANARAEAAERERSTIAERERLARWLWGRSYSIIGSEGEVYLRAARGYEGPLPATLRFLPTRDKHSPAMIAAFGSATEVDLTDHARRWDGESREPVTTLDDEQIKAVAGVPPPSATSTLTITDEVVTGVHLTRLLPDGSGKAVFDDPDEPAKIMIGRSIRSPIVLAPMNDGLALGITEGIEDGLSILQSLGIGVWVAGAASRLPALAEVVPGYTDTVLIFAHDDHDGQRHAAELGRRLGVREIDTKIVTLGSQKEAA